MRKTKGIPVFNQQVTDGSAVREVDLGNDPTESISAHLRSLHAKLPTSNKPPQIGSGFFGVVLGGTPVMTDLRAINSLDPQLFTRGQKQRIPVRDKTDRYRPISC